MFHCCFIYSFTYTSFIDTVSSDHTEPNGRIMWQGGGGTAAACIKLLSQHFFKGNEENHGKHPS
jgi:hypothetical protein